MKETIKLGFILLVITMISAGILGMSNHITAEKIGEIENKANYAALEQIFVDGNKFELLETGKLDKIKETNDSVGEIFEVYNGDNLIGYAVKTISSGYKGNIVIMTGFSIEGKLEGMLVLEQTETPGLGAKSAEPSFTDHFRNKSIDSEIVAVKEPSKDNEVQAISSATVTTNAVIAGVNSAREVFVTQLSN